MRMTKTIRIGPGEHHVTEGHGDKIVTVLGSCVAACIRDPRAGVGGMNHFMLPDGEAGAWGGAGANMRYGTFAMERLVNDILRRGGVRKRMEIKVFGGAAMLRHGAAVGHRNADFVEGYLKAERMALAASHLRGRYARRLEYEPLSGRVRMLELKDDVPALLRTEGDFLRTIRQQPASGTAELFD